MSIRSTLRDTTRLARRAGPARRRTLVAVAASLLAGVLAVVGLASPAQADGTFSASNAVGYVQGSVSSGSDYVYLSGQVRDTNCSDSSSPTLDFNIYTNGGTLLTSWWLDSPSSCGSTRSSGTPIYAAALKGNRSGYVTMSLCQTWWFGTYCTGSFASTFYSI